MALSSTAIRRIYKEVLSLRKSPPPGIQIVDVDDSDIDLVTVILEGPEQTPFEDGVFHLRLQFTPEYPAKPPTAHFITKIFHPNIAPRTGEVCVNTLKRDWNSKVTLSDILMVLKNVVFQSVNQQTIKSLLIDPNPTSALNEEAGKLLLEDYPSYCSHAKLFTEVHALRPKPLVIPPAAATARSTRPDESKSIGSSTPLTSSQAQNTLPAAEGQSGEKPPARIFLFGIGLKRLEGENGENEPAPKRTLVGGGSRLAGRGDLRRL